MSANHVEPAAPHRVAVEADGVPLSEAGRSPVLDPAQLEVLGDMNVRRLVRSWMCDPRHTPGP
jgi:hypothetical protein